MPTATYSAIHKARLTCKGEPAGTPAHDQPQPESASRPYFLRKREGRQRAILRPVLVFHRSHSFSWSQGAGGVYTNCPAGLQRANSAASTVPNHPPECYLKHFEPNHARKSHQILDKNGSTNYSGVVNRLDCQLRA